MTARDRRALLWGGGAVLAAVIVLRVLPFAIRTARAAEADLRERAALLARARADLASVDALRDSAGVLAHAVVALAPDLVADSTPGDAAASLATLLGLAAERHHLKVVTTGPVDADTVAGRLGRVRVHAQLQGDMRGLVGLVHALERGAPALAVQSMRVAAPAPATDGRAPEVLAIDVTVDGWYLRPSGGTSR
ncbi:MAG TPA: type II secretion system protein GspM [Gemmatimonadales bacterium]|nr:type II secretion system protein GspM [Gemmatimonadales bacterium]